MHEHPTSPTSAYAQGLVIGNTMMLLVKNAIYTAWANANYQS